MDEPAGIQAVECTDADAEAWDAFIEQSGGTYCHLYGWRKVFERVYDLTTVYLSLRCGGEWVGALPVARMPGLPGGAARAVSVPYCNYGGLVAAEGLPAEEIRAAALEYLRARGIRTVDFREIAPSKEETGEISMLLALPETSAQLWDRLGAKVRNQIRKAERAGLTVRWGADQAGVLYRIYAAKMGELGTPVHSPEFVNEILRALSGRCDILTVRKGDRAIGAMLVIRFRGAWADPMAASLAEFKAMNPSMLLYWEALRAACEAGAAEFDFGRSPRDSGPHRFKKQWGAREITLHYRSYRDGEPVLESATRFYRSRRATPLVAVWKLLPGAIQRGLGPKVRRWLP